MGDRIFPLVDRRTPLLDRLQNGEGGDFTDQSAKELVAVRETDEEDAVELMETFSKNFKESLADEMGVDPEEINPNLVEEFMSFIFFEGPFVEDVKENETEEADEEDGESETNPLENITPDQE